MRSAWRVKTAAEKTDDRAARDLLERVDDAIEAALNPPQTHEPDMPSTTHTAPAEKRVARSR